jgi:hypothetical protein
MARWRIRMTTSKQYDDYHPMRYGERKIRSRKRCESRWRQPLARCRAELSHGVNRLSSIASTPPNSAVSRMARGPGRKLEKWKGKLMELNREFL